MKKLFVLLFALAFLVLLSGCCLQHEWVDATCTEPKTCSKCGKTEGEPLGHDWADATCTQPKKCKRCHINNGKPNGHTNGEWIITEEPEPGLTGERTMYCSVCGEELATEEVDALPVSSDGVFQLSPWNFRALLGRNIPDDLKVADGSNAFSNAYLVVVANEEQDIMFRIMFSTTDNPERFSTEAYLKESESDNVGYNTLSIFFDNSYHFNANEFLGAINSVLQVLHPNYSESELNALASQLIDLMSDVYDNESDTYKLSKYSVNEDGLCYRFGILLSGTALVVQPE